MCPLTSFQVPRTFHNGIRGTFMDEQTHNRYFKHIAYNKDTNVTWPRTLQSSSLSAASAPLTSYLTSVPPRVTLVSEVYEGRIEQLLTHCQHISHVKDLGSKEGGTPTLASPYSANDRHASTGVIYCIWISVDPEPMFPPPEFEPIARFFGLWHEHQRAAHNGLHEFFWDDGSYILLINTYTDHNHPKTPYAKYKPSQATVLRPHDFDNDAIAEYRRRSVGTVGYAAAGPGVDCDTTCSSLGMVCKERLLRDVNTCDALKERFPCHSCSESFGPEQPAYVIPSAPRASSPDTCLYSSQPERSTCSASHPLTIRLCACAK